MDRQAIEAATFAQVLNSFGEIARVTDSSGMHEVDVVATGFDESARYLTDSSTYADFAGEMHHAPAVQFTWMLEARKSDWEFEDDAVVNFRSQNYKIVGKNETDVNTYRIFLIETKEIP